MVAFMQGRLTPPADGRIQFFPGPNWADEFYRAAEIGLDGIEWVYDVTGLDHDPLQNGGGIRPVAEVARASGVAVRSVCADWFMVQRLASGPADERAAATRRLRELLTLCAGLEVSRVVLPFVDASSAAAPGGAQAVVAALEPVLPLAGRLGVELHLETDLGPEGFAALLSDLDAPAVRVNYDIGNSAGLGYDPRAEFAAYGDRLGSVHIKDRRLGATTVPLGAGDADFAVVRQELARRGFDGPYVLQAARGPAGDEVRWLGHTLDTAADLLGLGPQARPVPGSRTFSPGSSLV